jgi:hypothetical protein
LIYSNDCDCILYNICQDHTNVTIEQYIQESMEFINENNNEEREEITFQDENNFAARNLRHYLFNIMQQEKKQCQSMKVVNFFYTFYTVTTKLDKK